MFLMFSIFDRPSVEDLLPILDFKNIKDPNELFLAHERLESKCFFFPDCTMDVLFLLVVLLSSAFFIL